MKFNLLYFIRLFSKHLYLIVGVPVTISLFVFWLTKDEPRTYVSQTTVFTSLATGNSIDLTTLSFNTINTAFDNLMGVIKSRETLEDVGLRLFASHLCLDKADPLIILPEHYAELMKSTPPEIKRLKVSGNFEQTYKNLEDFKNATENNYLTRLVSKSNPFYSGSKILAKLKVKRLQNSDNLEFSYESSDPGICQHTLIYLVQVYKKAYYNQKSGQSDNAVAYFEAEVAKAAEKLKDAENELLAFNQLNQIINYNEQSKFIAARKEQFEAGYQEVLKQNASAKAVIELLEKKMSPEDKRKLTGSKLLDLRSQLAKVNQDIALESVRQIDDSNLERQSDYKKLVSKSVDLKAQMLNVVDSLYNLNNSITGIPTNNIITDWLTNVIDYEGTNAKLATIEDLRADFIKIYSRYAPMGATMRRLERKINVFEDEYISLVKNLGLAKLKQQSVETSSGNTILDPPFYPSTPQPDKGIILIIAAGLAGFVITIFSILIADFMDSTLRNASKAASDTGMDVESIYPVVLKKKKQKIDIEFVEKKSAEVIARRLVLHSLISKRNQQPIICIAFSTRDQEGKTFLLQRIAEQLYKIGQKVLILHPHTTQLADQVGYDIARYIISDNFHQISTIRGLVTPEFSPVWESYSTIFIEFPGIINSSYPINLFKTADHCFLVCRANRSWSHADANILTEILEVTDPVKPKIILNGVAIEEMETILGDLPRKRSWLRKIVKSIIARQAYDKSIGK